MFDRVQCFVNIDLLTLIKFIQIDWFFCTKFIPSRSEQISSQQNSIQKTTFREPIFQEPAFQVSTQQMMLNIERQNPVLSLPVNRNVSALTALQLQQSGMEIVYGEFLKKLISRGVFFGGGYLFSVDEMQTVTRTPSNCMEMSQYTILPINWRNIMVSTLELSQRFRIILFWKKDYP